MTKSFIALIISFAAVGCHERDISSICKYQGKKANFTAAAYLYQIGPDYLAAFDPKCPDFQLEVTDVSSKSLQELNMIEAQGYSGNSKRFNVKVTYEDANGKIIQKVQLKEEVRGLIGVKFVGEEPPHCADRFSNYGVLQRHLPPAPNSSLTPLISQRPDDDPAGDSHQTMRWASRPNKAGHARSQPAMITC